MEQEFLTYNHLLESKSLLLAVSGGVDSMVLLYLCQKFFSDIHVVHVDHHTRQGQSTKDAIFIEDYCKQKNIPFYLGHFEYHSGNFQNEARSFRKELFESIRQKYRLDYILTGHHQDDLIENFIFASFRGAKLNRLVTPRYAEGQYIRPLIFFDKSTIQAFAESEKIPHVVDHTNTSIKYNRNYLRNHILPQIYQRFPQGKKGIVYTLNGIDKDMQMLEKLLKFHERKIILQKDNYQILDLDYLINHQLTDILTYFIYPFGFNQTQAQDILDASPGQRIQNKNYIITKGRGQLHIKANEKNLTIDQIKIYKTGTYVWNKYSLSIEKCSGSPQKKTSDQNQIYLYLDKSHFPLTVRSILPGDRIKPDRLKGNSIKINKLIRDLKVNSWKKSEVLILCSDTHIHWAYPLERAINIQNIHSELYLIRITSA